MRAGTGSGLRHASTPGSAEVAPSRSGLLSTPLAQFGLGAVALVVAAAILFALIGMVTEGDPVASPPVVDNTTEATLPPTEPGAEPTSPPSPTSPTSPTSPATAAPTTEATEAPTTTPTGEPTSQIDPGTVTVQVLDGVGDSDQQFEAVVACLRDAGYQSLITNQAAVAYEVTQVFHTPGQDNEAAARQVAGAISRSSVEEKPDNLSDTVPVHVVVGRDATSPC